ncbi:metallophosphoesterase [Flavobacteriaceae bacterium R38]|nr:metallophosphoesterase [Flavobacteriaceae bacterium R38]
MKKRIAFITDVHLDEEYPIKQGVNARENWKLIMKDVASRGINDVVFGGDMGENSASEWFFETLKGFDLKLILGNHDTFSEASKYYKNEFQGEHKELYYAFEDDYFKHIFLDSSSGEISKTQFLWFKGELNTEKKIIVFIHHPIIPVATLVDKKYYLLERAKIKNELLDKGNEAYVFCGHYHMIDEIVDKNVKQIISPAASYQIIKIPDEVQVTTKNFGYRIIEVDKDQLKTYPVLYKNGGFVTSSAG